MPSAAALEQWPRDGVPGQSARLAGVGRALQGDRRHAPARAVRSRSTTTSPSGSTSPSTTRRRGPTTESVEDDRLRLIFTCCHPALAPDAQVALTLREVCGLTTEEIAQRLPHAGADARAAHRAREGEDPRRAHSVPGARRRPSCRSGSTRCCASSTWCSTKATPRRRATSLTRRRSVRRGDPARAAARRAAARARGDRACWR